MQGRELRELARKRMKGQRRDAMTVVGVCLLGFGVLWLAEFEAAGLLLRLEWLRAEALERFCALDALVVLRMLLGLWVMTPLLSGACWWFVQAAAGERNPLSCVLVLYRTKALNRRAVRLYALLLLIAAIGLLPCGLSFAAMRRMMALSLAADDATWQLFAALQFLVLGVLLLAWQVRLLVSVLPAMLLFATDPLTPALMLIRRSYRLMKPRRGQACALLLREVLCCLPVVTIPFRLPGMGVRAALFLRAAEREEETDAKLERAGCGGAADTAQNLSAGALRDVRPVADASEAAGGRHPLQRQAHPHGGSRA